MPKRKRPENTRVRRVQTREKKGRDLERRHALYIVEVARATHEGRLPVNQTDIMRELRSRCRVSLAPSQSSSIVRALRDSYKGRQWLKKNVGQDLVLASEDTVLVDAQAIEALKIAQGLVDADDQCSSDKWRQACLEQIQSSRFEKVVEDLIKCGYVSRTGLGDGIRVEIRVIGEEDFYLREVRKARLRKRTSRPPQV